MTLKTGSGKFPLNGRREEAALLLAEDRLTDVEIAARAGVTDRQLRVWKAHPLFAARVAEHAAALAEAVRGRGIADRQNRVDALSDRWERMQAVITARAGEYAGAAPGADSGLLVRAVKLVKVYEAVRRDGGAEFDQVGAGSPGDLLTPGAATHEVTEWAVDTGLLRELREHEKQAAQELGQWTEKRELSGEMLIREYVGIDLSKV